MSKFQLIVLAIFVICIAAGVAVFATFKSKSSSTALPSVEIWGTFPQSVFNSVLAQINTTRESPLSVHYVELTEANFNQNLIATLAKGTGPDAILIPQDMIARFADKIIQVPNTVLTARDFKNTFISEAELYLTSAGTLAVPFTVDPLVMYWNRDIFTNAGIATYPKFWDDFGPVINKIDVKDVNSNIRRSAIAMGEFTNIDHARELLGALLMQAGNPVTTTNPQGVLASTLGDGEYQGYLTSSPPISFFTQFSNPQNPLYSWNRGLPSAKNWFLSGNLATYFGFASELYDIRAKNPNIDFDVAPLPQPKNGTNRTTYGKMYGFSILRTAKDQTAMYSIIQILTSPAALSELSKETYLPPVRRDMIASGSTDPYQAIFLDSALIAKDWLDIDSTASSQIMGEMIESITSGKADMRSAINTASQKLDLLVKSQ